jgi:hypothetical protein
MISRIVSFKLGGAARSGPVSCIDRLCLVSEPTPGQGIWSWMSKQHVLRHSPSPMLLSKSKVIFSFRDCFLTFSVIFLYLPSIYICLHSQIVLTFYTITLPSLFPVSIFLFAPHIASSFFLYIIFLTYEDQRVSYLCTFLITKGMGQRQREGNTSKNDNCLILCHSLVPNIQNETDGSEKKAVIVSDIFPLN